MTEPTETPEDRIANLEWQCDYLQREHTQRTNERRANDLSQQVARFHEAFGYPVRHVPEVPSAEEIALRLRLITEEFCELLEAHGMNVGFTDEMFGRIDIWIEHSMSNGFNVDLPAAADALGDLDYVVEGTRLTYGIPRQAIANAIQESNMAKAGGTHDATGKLQKPEGWKPPDIEGVLREHGWRGGL